MHDDHDHDHDNENPWADRINEAYYDVLGAAFGQKTRERINWMCKQARGKTVLDVGCSQGIAAILMAREGMVVTGLDIYPPAIEYAMAECVKENASVQERLEFRCGELAAIDGEQFDTVVMGEVVEHQTNPVRFMRQGAARVAPGGRIIITVPYGLHPWPDHKSTIFPRDLHEALADAFSLESLEVTDGYIRVVADRRCVDADTQVDMHMLLRATETGAIDAQTSYYAANSAAQGHVKTKSALESAIKALREDQGKLALRDRELERDLAVSIERVSGLQAALERAQQAVIDSSAEYAEVLRGLREDQGERLRALREESAEALRADRDGHAEAMRAQREEYAEALRQERERYADVVRAQREEHAGALSTQSKEHAEALRQESERYTEAVRAQRGEHAEVLRTRLEEHAEQVQRREAIIESHVQRIEDLIQQIASLQLDLVDVRAREHNATGRVTTLRAEIALLRDAEGARSRTLLEAAESARARAHDLQGEVDGMKVRIHKMTADLVEAQEKRSGHWAKLVAEQTRSRQLTFLAQKLHEDGQRYEYSIALAIGRAIRGLGSVRGVTGFPREIASVVRLYQRRRRGVLTPTPLVLPPLPALKTAAKPAGAAIAVKQAPKPVGEEQKKKLTVVGWEQKESGSFIPVLSVLDEFSRACFAPHANLIEPRPDNWEALLEKFSPRFLLAESAWRGNRGTWRYRVASIDHPPGNEFAQMTDGFRSRGTTTIFWNKEDPVHFDAFIESAGRCDVILTTSVESIERYRSRTSARVEVMQFAAEDTLHNPQGSSRRNGKICFAGSYYAEDFKSRQGGQSMLFEAAKAFDLDIYDRNHRSVGVRREFEFPEEYAPYVRGRLDYDELSRKYREYQVFLNVNSVDDSSTMFSRRVFELLACGTPVVSTWSRGIAETFGDDIVWQVKNRAEAEEALRVLTSDPQEWRRRSLAGIRAVLSRHTFRHRFGRILSLAGERAPEGVQVIAIAEVAEQPQADAVLVEFRRQQVSEDIHRKLLVVCRNGFRLQGTWPDVRVISDTQAPLAQIIDRERESAPGAIAAMLSPNAVYGRYYLQDAVNAIRYSGALVVGKAVDGTEYEWGRTLDPRTLVFNAITPGAEIVKATYLLDAQGGLMPSLASKTYAADSANYAAADAAADRDSLLKKIEI